MAGDPFERWRTSVYDPSLRAAPERRGRFLTSSLLELAPVYVGPGETELPGAYPFTRGIHPSMYRSRLWTMRQYAGFGDAMETNRRFRYLLAQGQTGLSVAFDLPTQMGYDSDAAQAAGEVGRVGVAIDSLADMEVLFAGIPLSQVSTSMTINATASTLLALYLALAERQDVPFGRLRGTVQNDILKEYIARGTFIYPPRPSMRLVTDTIAYCRSEVPQWNTVSISGYHVREAGATAAQEIAFTLADGIAYVQAAVEAGLEVDSFAPRLAFFFNVHNQLFEEVAKFRAARALWARIMKERFGAKDPRSQMLRFHAQTAGSTLTAQQPLNNAVRVTLQALAAVLGGAQSIHTNGMDEALGLPSEEAATLALRTQQILALETGVADVVDPLGGAHLVESLTRELVDAAEKILQRIDEQGGMIAAIEAGFPQREIEEAAYRTQRAIESGEQGVVGVNVHVSATSQPLPVSRPAANEEAQRRRLSELRAGRDRERWRTSLAALEHAAAGSENLMPFILAAVRAQATVGEIADTLRRVFGVY